MPECSTTCRDTIAQRSRNTRADFGRVKLEEGKAISQHLHAKLSRGASSIAKDETLDAGKLASRDTLDQPRAGYLVARNFRALGYTAPLDSKLPLSTAQVHGRVEHGRRASPVTSLEHNLNVKTENSQFVGASYVHRTRKLERGMKRDSTETTRTISNGLINGLVSDAGMQMKTEGETFSQADGFSDRRVHSKLDNQTVHVFQSMFNGEYTEKSTGARTIRQSGGKDRHSKVFTSKGPRDRRVRLSVSTAIQFYDVQDRLGYDQPSKAVDWLIKKAKSAIDELEALPELGLQGFATGEANAITTQNLRIQEPKSSTACRNFACNSNEAGSVVINGSMNSVMPNVPSIKDQLLQVQSTSETSLLLNEDQGLDSASPKVQQIQQIIKDDAALSPVTNSSMLQSIRPQGIIPELINGRQFIVPHYGSSNQSLLQSLIMLSPEQIHDFGCEISAADNWTSANKFLSTTHEAGSNSPCSSIARPDRQETDPFRHVITSTLDQHQLLSTSPPSFGDLVQGVSGKPSSSFAPLLNSGVPHSSHMNIPYGSYMVHRASIPARIHGFDQEFEGDQQAAFSSMSET